jgi:hypothetical protein
VRCAAEFKDSNAPSLEPIWAILFFEMLMSKSIRELTTLLRLLTFRSGAIVVHKTFGDRTCFRWEIFAQDRSSWIGTLSFGDEDILRLATMPRPAEVSFLTAHLAASIGRRDDLMPQLGSQNV